MATSKTLTPTNVTIQIPAFTDKPDQRVNSNCIDKEADAINALSDQIANTSSTFKTSGTITVEQQVSGVQIDANRIMCGVILPFVIYSSGSTVTVNSCTILGVGSATATVDAKTTNSIRFSISHSGTAGQAFFIVINFTITLT